MKTPSKHRLSGLPLIGSPTQWEDIKKAIERLPYGSYGPLAKQLGVTPSGFSKILVSRYAPSYQKVLVILNYLRIHNII
jgi:hypothetical protein